MNVSTASRKKTYNVAVVGATGAVGMEMVRMLDERKFPVKKLRLFASERSNGRSLIFNKKNIAVEVLKYEPISNLDVAIFSAGASVSRAFAPLFVEKGVVVIDNSSAWRMDPSVPLVIPEVNPHVLTSDKKIIANPNCSTIQMVVVLKPIHDVARIKSVRVATYQAVSGAGGKAIQDLEQQARAWAQGKEIPPSQKIPHQIAFNIVPQIDAFSENGNTEEELKMVNETRKIMESTSINLSAMCVRVPVFRSHSEAVWIETERPISVQRAREILSTAPGVVLQDEPEKAIYPMPIKAAGQQMTYVGRIKQDSVSPNGLLLWIVSDNLLKGAALNAVEIAELLVRQKIL